MARCPSRFPQVIVFSVGDQSGRSETITICQIPCVGTACNLEHRSTSAELPALSVTSEKNGCRVNMVSSVWSYGLEAGVCVCVLS